MTYLQVDFATLVASGRAREIEWIVDAQGREIGFDVETRRGAKRPGASQPPRGSSGE